MAQKMQISDFFVNKKKEVVVPKEPQKFFKKVFCNFSEIPRFLRKKSLELLLFSRNGRITYILELGANELFSVDSKRAAWMLLIFQKCQPCILPIVFSTFFESSGSYFYETDLIKQQIVV